MPKEVYISLRTDGEPGTGALDNPFNGSTDTLLDGVLGDPRKVPSDTTIHFGPGIFQTKGFGGLIAGWVLRDRQRIMGAGIYATTLQLVKGAPNPGQAAALAAIWGNRVTGIEISDLTVDANLGRQPKAANQANAKIKADGITIYNATNVRISRVRVINWGTYTPGAGAGSHEGFPIYLVSPVGASGARNVVQNCIIEQPAFSQARETTMLNNHAENAGPGILCLLRNNFLNGEYTTGSIPEPVEVSAVEDERIRYDEQTGVVSIKTALPHRLQAGDSVIIAGAKVSGYNGRWKVETADDNRAFTFKSFGLSTPPRNSGITAQRYVPPAMGIVKVSSSGSNITLTTPAPHLREVGDYIRVSGIKTAGNEDNPLNGSFEVKRVTVDTIQYRASSAPDGRIEYSAARLDRWRSVPAVITALTWLEGIATVTLAVPHFKAPGDYILLTGIYDANRPDYSAYNGYHKVLTVLNSLQFTCAISKRPDPPSYATAMVPQHFQGLSATVGYGGRVCGNRVIDVYTGGPYKDSTSGAYTPDKDLTTRDNYYHFVYVGTFTNIQLPPPGTKEDYRQWWNLASANIVDLQPFAKGTWNHSVPGGLVYWGPYAQNPAPPLVSHFPSIDTLIAWDNIVRFVDWEQGPAPRSGTGHSQFGIYGVSVENLVFEDNIVTFSSSAQAALGYYAVSSKTTRNNISADGTELSLLSRAKTLRA